MENDLTILDFIEACYPHGLPEEILFYGGSFNPWHSGHREALKRVEGKHVMVMPDRNPLKAINPFSIDESLEQIRADLSVNQWLYTDFLNRRTHNPTQVWISEVRRKFPQLKIGLLMGFDNFAILDKWFNADKLIADLSCLYLLSRNDDEEVKNFQCDKIRSLNNGIEFNFLGKHDYEDVSSTLIRQENNKNLVAAV